MLARRPDLGRSPRAAAVLRACRYWSPGAARSPSSSTSLPKPRGGSPASKSAADAGAAPGGGRPGGLEFFNGLGGFAKDGREYVDGPRTGPRRRRHGSTSSPIRALASRFGAEGGGTPGSENSRENQLTPWSNDPVTTRPAKRSISATRNPASSRRRRRHRSATGGTYVARHGRGYSRFEHRRRAALDLIQFVPLGDPVKISRLTLRNMSDRAPAALYDGLRRMGARRHREAPRPPTSRPRSTRRPGRSSPAIPGAPPSGRESRSPIWRPHSRAGPATAPNSSAQRNARSSGGPRGAAPLSG